MKIKEWIQGSGIYSVPAASISDEAWFLRDPKLLKDGEVGPLLHICTRDLDPGFEEATYVITTGHVRFNPLQGYYMCLACKEAFTSEEQLQGVWEDGFGTGDEAHA
jgi:hypothetical protein